MSVCPSRLWAISFMSWRRMRGLSVPSIFLKSAFTSRCCFLSRSVAFIVKHLRGSQQQDRCPCLWRVGPASGKTKAAGASDGAGGPVGQTAVRSRSGPPFELAAELSPLPQTRKVPVAFSEYLYV